MFGKPFVINSDSILVDHTVSKIEEIAKESKDKLSINFYVNIGKKLAKGKKLVDMLHDIKPEYPYIAMIVSIDDRQIDIFSSNGLESLFDKDKILDKYTIPLLIKYGKKPNSPSAAILNGYSALIDDVANTKGVTINSTIGSQSSTTVDIIRLIVYSTMLFMFMLYLYLKFRGRYGKK